MRQCYRAGIYDVYDDDGLFLRSVAPSPDDLPPFVKEASVVDQAYDSSAFALVIVEDGKAFKKYAMADAGNTWLSVLYFARHKDQLPMEAQKVAAAHLLQACDAYDIEVPDELAAFSAEPPESRFVNLTNVELDTAKVASAAPITEQTPHALTMPDGSERYPLRDAREVKTAMQYFEDHAAELEPAQRREFAVKVAGQAERAALPLPDMMGRYASDGWNSQVDSHITSRGVYITTHEEGRKPREQLAKLAALRHSVTPSEFAVALEMFDRENHLDHLWDDAITDPWYSSLGMPKVASKSYQVGDRTVTEAELERLALEQYEELSSSLGSGFANAFRKQACVQFEALPVPQQRMLAQMVEALPE